MTDITPDTGMILTVDQMAADYVNRMWAATFAHLTDDGKNSRLVTMNRTAWALRAAAIAQHGDDDATRVEVDIFAAAQTVARFLEMDDRAFSRELVLIAEADAHRINDTGTTDFATEDGGPFQDPDCQECGFRLPKHDRDCSSYREGSRP